MKASRFLLLLAIVGVISTAALAGPNSLGTLVVHDMGLNASCEMGPAPASCETIDNQLPVGPPASCGAYYWKVYAAFLPSASPRLKALSWAASFPADVSVVAAGLPDPVLDFEIVDAGWPTTSGAGLGISFGVVKTGVLNECYWFAGYGYGGTWRLIPHPVHGAVFIDDASPANEDPIVALGSLGFGVPGSTPCPWGLSDAPDGPEPGRVQGSWGRLKEGHR
jgi:hypothetical protein